MTKADPSRPVRFVAVTPKAIRGGAERWLESILVNTRRLRSTLLVLDHGWLSDHAREQGIRVSSVPTGRSLRELAAALWQTRTVLRQADADVILLNGTKPGLVALPWALLSGRRTIYVKHGAQHDRSLSPVIARLADRCIAVSDQQAAMLPPAKTTVINPPRPEISAEAVGMTDHAPLRLVMLCRLFPSKGIDKGIEAIAASPRWELVVAGPEDEAAPGERDRLLTLAAELGASGRVHLVGEVAEPTALLRSSDAAAVLSRPWGPAGESSEGFGLVVVEAAAAGVPVIADPERIPSVAAMDGAGVIPIEGDDAESICTALRALEDPGKRNAVGAEGRLGALKIPDEAEAADQVAEVAAEVVLRPGAGRTGGAALSVIVPLLNEMDTIDELLAHLLPQLRRDDRMGDDELILVDNGSTDGTWEHIRRIGRTNDQLRACQVKGGVSRARNAAVALSRHDWLAFTDAGCRPQPDWLQAFRVAASTGNFDLLTGLTKVAADHRIWQRAAALATYPLVSETARPDAMVRIYRSVFGMDVHPFAPGGRCLAVNRRTFDAVGGFPEDMTTAEDVEFGLRIRDAGGRASIVLDAVVEWDQRESLPATWRMYRRYGEGDGRSGRPMLIGRSLARAAAYGIGPLLLVRGGAGRWAVLVGGGLYVSLPIRRALTAAAPARVVATMPLMMAVKDFGKAVGCARGVWQRNRPTRSG